jgi:hypothetical protein
LDDLPDDFDFDGLDAIFQEQKKELEMKPEKGPKVKLGAKKLERSWRRRK